jgi:hypothetical protein
MQGSPASLTWHLQIASYRSDPIKGMFGDGIFMRIATQQNIIKTPVLAH